MEQRKKSGLRGILGSIYRGIDAARRFFWNGVFLVILVLLLGAAFSDDTPEVPESTVLVISPVGQLVEQLAGDAQQRAIDKLTGDEKPETLVRDLIKVIEAAKDDDRVKVLLLDLDSMSGGHLPKMQRLRRAIDDFKESGKPVLAAADAYSRDPYYMASCADEIYVHHMGAVLIDGYGRWRTYHREAIDRLEIDWNVFKVGEYKSAVEPFLRSGMSDEAREANREWLGDLWASYLEDVAAARNLTPEALMDGIDRFVELLNEAEGRTSQVALDAGLVDHVGARDALRERLIELVGEDEDTHSYYRIGHGSYLETLEEEDAGGGDTVAVIVAKGSILNGSQPPGTIGGDSTAKLIREARQDEDVKALVLRVDSGGGSAFASEVIRREFVLAREAGKKVVVSMGGVAASGGYWISSASDEIWASPNTITGSIGIFGMLPTFQKPMAKHLGTRVDGVGTTWLSGALRTDRELQPKIGEAFQVAIERGYEEFLARVSEARGMTRDEVDEIARGRVWSGVDALELGLVDKLGDLEEAIASAASLAELGDEYTVRYEEEELDFTDQLMVDMLSHASVRLAPALQSRQRQPALVREMLGWVERQSELLAQFDDPRGVYAHCLCEVE